MSVPHNPHQPLDADRAFWIRDRDDDGRPVDPRFLEAAYAIGGELLRYREHELRDEHRAVELLEQAVHSANRSRHKKPVANFTGYLVQRFTSIVDTVLRRESRVQYQESQKLEECHVLEDELERWHNDLRIAEALSVMDDETRRICIRLMAGYKLSEIARELGVTPNSVYLKFRRGSANALKRLETKSAADHDVFS